MHLSIINDGDVTPIPRKERKKKEEEEKPKIFPGLTTMTRARLLTERNRGCWVSLGGAARKRTETVWLRVSGGF